MSLLNIKTGDMVWVERGVSFYHLEDIKEGSVYFRRHAEQIVGAEEIVIFCEEEDAQEFSIVILLTRYGLRKIQSIFVHPIRALPMKNIRVLHGVIS